MRAERHEPSDLVRAMELVVDGLAEAQDRGDGPAAAALVQAGRRLLGHPLSMAVLGDPCWHTALGRFRRLGDQVAQPFAVEDCDLP